MNITIKDLAVAFEEWETNYRLEPSTFMTTEEISKLEVSELSADRAAYMMELLKTKETHETK